MITELEIKGFRGFKDYRLHDLGRINLLVGQNNGGKTSILEAVQLLGDYGYLDPFYMTMIDRGEYIWSTPQTRNMGFVSRGMEIDIRCLFYNYKLEEGSEFQIRGNRTDEIRAMIQYDTEARQLGLFNEQTELFEDPKYFESMGPGPYILMLIWKNLTEESNKKLNLRLSNQRGISLDNLRRSIRGPIERTGKKIVSISTSSLSLSQIADMLGDIVLTSEEQLVVESMKIIEPKIERIASINSDRKKNSLGTKGGIVVKCKGINERIPIGSLGDGIWRILGMTLALVKAENGILLIDEIDTGLHFTVMENMWKLMADTANRLNVQIFATTHNSDCWTSLAAVLRDQNVTADTSTSIQRIEKDKNQAVAFTENEIIIAAERKIEVR